MTPLLSLTQQPWAQLLGWSLLHFLWQGLALGLVAWGALTALRGADARARYGVACGCLLLMAAAPCLTFLWLRATTLPPAEPLHLASLGQGFDPGQGGTLPLALRLKLALSPALPWLLLGWGLGVLLFSARFLGGWLRVQRLRRARSGAVPAHWHGVLARLCRELNLTRPVRLLQSMAIEVPTALGWLRPIILLPAFALTGLAPQQLEAILAHELAHLQRGDFMVNLLQTLVEVVLFYHPAVWWLSRRIRTERELCCDDVAARLCGDPLLLARALTELETLREPLAPSPTHLALAANGGSLMQRIHHLLHPALPITSGARTTALAILAASLLGAAGVALQEKGEAARPHPQRTTKIQVSDGARTLEVRLKGEVNLQGEAPEPVTISGNGSFRVTEKKGGKHRAYTAAEGKATYTVDGKEVPMDQAGKDWLRSVVTEVRKAQAAAPRTPRATGEPPSHAQAEVIHELEAREKTLDLRERELDRRGHELETRFRSAKPGERPQLEREMAQLKAEGETLKAEGAQFQAERDHLRAEAGQALDREVQVKVIKQRGKGPGTVIITRHGPGEARSERRIETETDDSGPRTILIREHASGKEVVEKQVRILEDGTEEVLTENIHPMPRDPEDARVEMAAIQAELRALQARLDQLRRHLATPPRPPKAPKPLKPQGPAKPPIPHADPEPPLPPPPPPPPPPPAPGAPPVPPAPPTH